MHPFFVAILSFLCIFGGAMLGLIIQGWLPAHHLKPESKDAVKLGAGLIATMAALVLGILVGSAKSSFDGISNNLTEGGAKFIYLDRVLAEYGPEAAPIRADVTNSVKKVILFLWPEEHAFPGMVTFGKDQISGGVEEISAKIRDLPEATRIQAALRVQALQAASDIMQYRWLVLEQSQNVLPRPFLMVLLFWLTTLNFTYGLFAPRNGTVIAVLLACSLAVSGALFLIVEMENPLEGVIKVSSRPLHKALEFIGK